jgi:plastocyanin
MARGIHPGPFLYPWRAISDILLVMKSLIAVVMVLMATALAILPGAAPVQAQTFDLSVTPAKVELTVQPGQRVDFSITLVNSAAEPLELSVYPMDYYINPDNTFVFEEPGYYSYSCANWITIVHDKVVVPPNSQIEEPFSVTVPQGAEPGGHYGVIFFQDANQPPPEQGPAPIPRIGSLTLITVPGDIIREGSITKFEVQDDYFSLWGPPPDEAAGWPARRIKYHLEIENTGNVHITVYAQIQYRSRFGFGSGTVELGFITVLPGTVRYYDGDIPSPPGLGFYKATATIAYGKDQATYDIEKSAQTSFVVIPILWILAVILALLALWFLIRFAGRKLHVSVSIGGNAEGGGPPKKGGRHESKGKPVKGGQAKGRHEKGYWD